MSPQIRKWYLLFLKRCFCIEIWNAIGNDCFVFSFSILRDAIFMENRVGRLVKNLSRIFFPCVGLVTSWTRQASVSSLVVSSLLKSPTILMTEPRYLVQMNADSIYAGCEM